MKPDQRVYLDPVSKSALDREERERSIARVQPGFVVENVFENLVSWCVCVYTRGMMFGACPAMLDSIASRMLLAV